MKKFICLMLSVVLLCLCGCSGTEKPLKKPAAYYYCISTESYKTQRKAINFELRESIKYDDDLQGLLNDYLKGPESDSLVNPFPDNCTVESIQQIGSEMQISLSSRFARLTGVDLILACACISLTVFEQSDCQSVTFRVQNARLDGNQTITLSRDDIMLDYVSDEYI